MKRLSIELLPEEHKQIKLNAAILGKTIREYVLESIKERLRQDREEKQLTEITANVGSALKELWDNEKDAVYDKL